MSEEHKELDAYIQSLALDYSADFVPQPESRDPDQEQINWRIKIKGPGYGVIDTPYSQGIAHLPGYQFNTRRTLDVDKAIKTACQTGRWSKAIYNHSSFYFPKPLPAPLLRDVLYCLLMDSDVLEHSGFEDWAGDFGYDIDSRKAESIYRDCLEIALKMRNMLGDEKLNTLRELFQDY